MSGPLKKPKAILKNMIALYGTHKFEEGRHCDAGAMDLAKAEQNTAHSLLLEIERELDALFVLAEKGYVRDGQGESHYPSDR